MAFSNLPEGCSVPEIPDIDVPDLCNLPKIPEPETFQPRLVRLPPVPNRPRDPCIDTKVDIKAENCLGIDLEIPGSFGTRDGSDCLDGEYVMDVELPCWMVGPLIATLKTGGSTPPDGEFTSYELEDARTMDGTEVDLNDPDVKAFCAPAASYGGAHGASSRSTVICHVAYKGFTHVRS